MSLRVCRRTAATLCRVSELPSVLIVSLNYAPEPTGIAPYTTRLAERLSSSGHSVRVLTGYPHYPEWKLRDGFSGAFISEEVNGVQLRRLRHFIPKRVTFVRRLHMELSFGVRVLFTRWNNPDIVLVVSPALFSSALALLRARVFSPGIVRAMWVQDLYSKGLEETGSNRYGLSKVMTVFERFVCRLAVNISVIHDRFGDYLIKDFALPSSRVVTIRNWTHLEAQVPVNRSHVRSSLGWGEQDIVVLHAGNMGVKQSLITVVEAARLADAKASRVRFVLLGDGNQRQKITAAADGIQRIEIIPPVPDEEFKAVLQCADLLLLNEKVGLREMAVPSKLTSYFSTGVPVIAATESDSTSAGEVRFSGAGVVVRPGSPEDILLTAENLCEDSQLAQTLGAAGMEYARAVLSEDTAIQKYEEWFASLVKTR